MTPSGEARKYDELRTRTIEIKRIFATMEPLLRRTINLSLNAEIASARIGEIGTPFGTVVKELSYMGKQLRSLIDELEERFSEILFVVGRWIQIERRLALYLKALRSIKDISDDSDEENTENDFLSFDDISSILSGRVKDGWDAMLSNSSEDQGRYHLLENTIKCRKELISQLAKASGLIEQLSSLIEKLNMVAVRQSHFVAVTALIESTKVGSHSVDINTVAKSIQQLAADISKVESTAKESIWNVASMASYLSESAGR